MSTRSIEEARRVSTGETPGSSEISTPSRPEVSRAPAPLNQADWDHVHESIQARLARLWKKISAAAPGSLSRPGRTVAPAFALFSYRVFFRKSLDEDDPILVGVTIREKDGRYRAEGQIVGEESGWLHFDEEFEIPEDSPDWIDRVNLLADRLAAKEAVVLAAMAEGGNEDHEADAGAR